MTTLLLLRHGHTRSVGEYLAGRVDDVPLTAEGETAAAKAADALARVKLGAVVSSPLRRCRQTAERIAARHAMEPRISDALTEFDFGGWTGRTFAELASNPEWHRFNTERETARPPGGELMLDVQQRVVSALLEMSGEYADQTIAIVSHADVLRAAVMFFLGMPIDHVHRLDISPAAISILTLFRDRPPCVRQLNGYSVPEDI
jgi:broad specificity phosphatase PhoE